MRKCPKCSAIFDEHLNFCQACGAMLDTVMEEPDQTEDSGKTDENPEKVPSPAVSEISSSANHRPAGRMKEIMDSAIDNLRDLVSDIKEEHLGGTDSAASQLTLLNLSRYSTTAFRPRSQCPICGSAKIVPKVPVRCKSPDGEINLSLYLDPVPAALNFKEGRHAELLADICSDCGHVELRVHPPKES